MRICNFTLIIFHYLPIFHISFIEVETKALGGFLLSFFLHFYVWTPISQTNKTIASYKNISTHIFCQIMGVFRTGPKGFTDI